MPGPRQQKQTERVLIREYEEKDRDRILDLFRLNSPRYFSPGEEPDLISYLDNEIEYYYVLELDDHVVGCGGFNFPGDPARPRISWDILHPDFQGKSLGSMLLRYRIEKLKAFRDVRVITVRTSQLVYPFYEKSGFTLVEHVKDYWAKGFDLCRMEMRVNPLHTGGAP